MRTSILGSSPVEVPPIGLGTVKLGRLARLKYPASQLPASLPSDQSVLELLATAAELGVTLIDTAPAYGIAEQRLGQLLYQVRPRDFWVLCTKAGEQFVADAAGNPVSTYDFSAAAITASVERSLAALRTDVLDIVLLHFSSQISDELILNQGEAYETLTKLQRQGKIKAIGASPASLVAGIQSVQRCQVAMLELSPAESRHRTAITEAATTGCGILIKKALASGHLTTAAPSGTAPASPDPVQAALRFVLGHAAVSSVVIGTTSPRHLRQAVLIAEAVRGV
jgi:aryl-alcohol dehydrogenase-like predicted oxidoreductase